jgi:hypothetical protein
MSNDARAKGTAEDDALQNLPERPVTDADQVKGGAYVAPPSGPVPIPYPNITPSTPRLIVPCV